MSNMFFAEGKNDYSEIGWILIRYRYL